jgi:hypothetical protein
VPADRPLPAAGPYRVLSFRCSSRAEPKEFTIEAVARVLGVSRASIYRHLADAEVATPEAPSSSPSPKPRPCAAPRS